MERSFLSIQGETVFWASAGRSSASSFLACASVASSLPGWGEPVCTQLPDWSMRYSDWASAEGGAAIAPARSRTSVREWRMAGVGMGMGIGRILDSGEGRYPHLLSEGLGGGPQNGQVETLIEGSSRPAAIPYCSPQQRGQGSEHARENSSECSNSWCTGSQSRQRFRRQSHRPTPLRRWVRVRLHRDWF